MVEPSKSHLINIKLVIGYDASTYYGWQKTPHGTSIEGKLQSTLELILQHPVRLQAASRTDRGVHATGQVVNFFTSRTSIDLNQLCYSLNQLLPKDLIVVNCEKVSRSFHPTIDCIGKEYHYYVCASRLQAPQHRYYSWHVGKPLEFEKIHQGIPLLLGRHHFEAFCNVRKTKDTYADYTREIQLLELEEIGLSRFRFKIRGTHFLYKMVRILVGTLIDIGLKKIAVKNINDILANGKRSQAGRSAPAHGLFLHNVFFP